MTYTVLIVDDEKHTREGLESALEEKYDVYLARDAEEALRLMQAETFDIILTDLRMSGKSGLKVIDAAMALPYRPICILMTAYGSIEVAVDAMRRGAFDFLTKPVHLEKLELLLERALQSRQLKRENTVLQERLESKYNSGIIGSSLALKAVLEQIQVLAPTKTTVLLEGETGTGKELIAQMLHQNSGQVRSVFIPVHCAALSANLLESELFGHEKGAFTGANERRIGRFESADKGTLFLDEIGEIDASTQVKLLRFLETKTIERLGSQKPVPLDIRLICATNRDLAAMVKEGKFREDLFYRLNVVTIKLPPLRQRRDDIPELLDYYLHSFSDENALRIPTLAPETLQILTQYPWPGNIRELRNFAENAVVLHSGKHILPKHLDGKFTQAPDPEPLAASIGEKERIRAALTEANGNKSKAAERLGISRRTLHRKLLQWPELDQDA